jgi:uncharacterized membrane protein YhaH (DUF805 family)
MKNFFKNLFNSSGDVSSKRFVGFISLIVLFLMFISNLFQIQIQTDLIYSFTSIVIVSFSLTSLEFLKK